MIVYATIIERIEPEWELNEPYRYVAGVYEHYEQAKLAGQVECHYHDNLYRYTVCDFVMNHINKDKMKKFKELTDEKQPL